MSYATKHAILIYIRTYVGTYIDTYLKPSIFGVRLIVIFNFEDLAFLTFGDFGNICV